nr:GATA zinc finger domain-containing protein 24 [Leptinotarsa decemlineata]
MSSSAVLWRILPLNMFSLSGNVLFICVTCFISSKMSSAESIVDFFPEVKGNLTRVTWAHAVNNSTYLTSVLQNNEIKMIEADILLGTLTGSTSMQKIPIMGHPPANSSDLSLENFLKTVTDFNSVSENYTSSNAPEISNNATSSPIPTNSSNTVAPVTGGVNNSDTENNANIPGVNGNNSSTINNTNESINTTSSSSTNNNSSSAVSGGNNAINENVPTNITNATISINATDTDSNTTLPDSSVQTKVSRATNSSDSSKKGVKLDFKTIQVFNESIAIIKGYNNASFPLWLNADILRGPGNPAIVPVKAAEFLSQAKQFTKATLSLGWTTDVSNGTGSYTDAQINQMIEVIKSHNITNEITFAVRSAIAAESLPQMRKLVTGIEGSTLTLWSAEKDIVDVNKLRTLISNIGVGKIYVDVPDSIKKQLNLDNLPPNGATLMSKMSGLILLLTFLLMSFS